MILQSGEDKVLFLGTRGICLILISNYRRKIVPWCISNGEEWIFGILTGTEEGNNLRYNNYRLPTLMVFAGSQVQSNNLETLFRLLIIWVSGSPVVCTLLNLRQYRLQFQTKTSRICFSLESDCTEKLQRVYT